MELRTYQATSRDDLNALYGGGHSRATLVLPCGTGKTVVAADQIPHNATTTALFVPTRALLAQTWAAMRRYRPDLTLLAICGPLPATQNNAEDLSIEETASAIGAAPTTDPDVVAAAMLAATTSPLLILSTYTSSAVLAEAVRTTGRDLDMLICDEAHRTAGTADKAWAAPVHTIGAARRLFMTATPRTITLPAEAANADLDTVEIISMSSITDYGPHVAPIGFRQAITNGYLADYEIAVVAAPPEAITTLHDSEPNSGHRTGAAATQLALLRSASTRALRSILVFHNRIDASRNWIKELQGCAETLGLPLYAAHIDGQTDPTERDAALAALANPGDRITVVSNCKVFSEGVDLPALDAVVFAAPRTAGPDIVQIVGRAIRPHPTHPNRKALIVLPVLDLSDDTADLDTKAARSSYLAAWQVLTSLAEEDELLHRCLAQWRDHIENDPDNTPPTDTPLHLDIAALSSAAQELVLRTVSRASSPHLVTVAHLRAFHADYGHTNPVAKTVTTSGFPLGTRVRAARTAYRDRRLHPRIAAQFETLPGWSWTLRTAGTQRTTQQWIALVHHFRTATGVSTISRSAWITDPATGTRANIGNWYHTQALKKGYLTADERAALDTNT